MFKLLSALLIAALLTACGGGDTPASSQQAPRQAAAVRASAAADYSDLVQLLYVGYFGRPADSGGLANFKQQLGAIGTGADSSALDEAYKSSAAVRSLVDSFGVSDESKALYTGTTDAFVTSIYVHLLNRNPDADGLAYWVKEINNGKPRSQAALSILQGAQTNTTAQGRIDAQVIANKAAVSRLFTAAADLNVYKGDTAAALARTMLAGVSQNTDVNAFLNTINETLKQMASAGGSIYAGSYSGSYGGDDNGSYTFTIAKDGTITGSGKSNVFGTQLVITGTLGNAGGQAVLLQGTIGPFGFTGTLTATGQLTGQWSGLGASGTLSAQRTGG